LLDTNIISHAMRSPMGPVVARMADVEGQGLYTTIIVAAELRFGAVRKGSPRLAQEVEAVLGRLSVKSIEPPLDQVYAALRSDLEGKGTPIGDADLWIAAQALHDGSVLVTDNVREFGRVPELRIENWLRP
jgi:tRNA(fMet)-specific endonuclease VapC